METATDTVRPVKGGEEECFKSVSQQARDGQSEEAGKSIGSIRRAELLILAAPWRWKPAQICICGSADVYIRGTGYKSSAPEGMASSIHRLKDRARSKV